VDRAKPGLAFRAAKFAEELHLAEWILDGEFVSDGRPVGGGGQIFVRTVAGETKASARARIANVWNNAASFNSRFEPIFAGLKPDFAVPGAYAAALGCAGAQDVVSLVRSGLPKFGLASH
jgi:hypothetical protein